jgi:cytochrome c biogenesis protein CcmG, thiol:disulfide interchange protein DsbE
VSAAGRHLALALVSFLVVFGGWRLAHPGAALHGRNPEAPAFSVAALTGPGRLDLSSYAGRVIVLNFWASWYGPCRAELPLLEREWKRRRGDVVTFVGVDVRDSAGDARRALGAAGVTYPVGHDDHYAVERLYSVSALPATFVIAPDGRVVEEFAGSVDAHRLAAAISRALD